MAGTVMHIVIADRLIEILQIQNPGYFFCGNLAPDAMMARKNYTREMKRHTHFKDGIHLHELRDPEKYAVYLERLKEFYHNFVEKEDPHHEIYLGYLTHMLVDELYIFHFRDSFVDRLVASGRSAMDGEFWPVFAKDVDLVDLELVKENPFHYPMPESLRIAESYEIPGLITAEELVDSKEFIIQKNFSGKKPERELAVMTMEENKKFIELCVQEIPQILRERF